MRAALVLALVVVASILLASVTLVEPLRDSARETSQIEPLPKIAPAPEFTLTSQDGAQISLANLRGKVVAVTFIFTLCTATCPVLTPMMSLVHDQLGPDFGSKVVFASITVDPERDTPEMLKLYAQMYGVDVVGWSFLTGPSSVIQDLTRRYGVFASKNADGDIEHSFLTSIVDRRGILRVQYLGVRFDPEEFRRDLVSLLRER
jgi:protein SCO1/2